MPRMSSDLRVTHKRASGLPGLRRQIMIGSFVGPCAREACSRGSSLSPVRVSMGKHSAQVWLRPPQGTSWVLHSRRSWGLPGTTASSPDRNEILRNLTSWVPQQRKRRGSSVTIRERDTKAATPRFQSVGGGMSSILQ